MTIATANDDHIAALRRQLATVADPVARVPLLRQLGEALVLRSPAEAERLLSEAYRSALAHGIEKELGRACWFLCELRRNDGDIEGARHWAERLGDAGQRFDSAFLRGYHQYVLGVTALSVGDHEAARLAHAQALRIWQEDGYRLGEISALNGLAAVAGKQGRTDDQLEILQQCMRVAEEIDAEQWRPWLAHALGGLLIELGRWEEAVQTFYRALAVSEQRGTLPLMSHAFIGLGEIFLLQGLLDRALAMFGRAAEAGRRRQTYPLTYRSAVAGAGETLLRQGSLAAAWSLLDEAATASLSVEGRATLTGIRCCQTEVALGRGMVRHAQELVAEALQIAEELSLTTETGEALRVKALVLAETGRFSEARAALDQALARLRGTQESYRLARVHRQFGRFLAARGEYLAAADHLQAAIRLLRRLAMVADAAETVHLLMTADLAQGSDAALLNALTTLSTLRLEPAMLIEHALSLTGEATN
ncbi:tetratricopeptide repeat protein, partial [candidate division WOR-3 bacterium]|nr:tetratricopeptide repeat protein [candidate division WOR-3 bacterium]